MAISALCIPTLQFVLPSTIEPCYELFQETDIKLEKKESFPAVSCFLHPEKFFQSCSSIAQHKACWHYAAQGLYILQNIAAKLGVL